MSEGTMTPGYLSIQSAAKWASVSERTIKRWIDLGLQARQGTARGKVLIRPGDIDAFLTRTKKKDPPAVSGAAREILTSLGYLESTAAQTQECTSNL